MSGLTVLCPSCRMTIKNAVPTPENKIRCGECGMVFTVPPSARRSAPSEAAAVPPAPPPGLGVPPPPRATAQAPRTPASADPAAVAADKAPLGPEPAPASYGLLNGVAWASLAYAVVIVCWQIYGLFKVGGLGSGMSFMDVIHAILVMAQILLAAAAGIFLTGCITRLDRRAAWIAWRSAALPKPVGEPPESSLPFILPWSVAGGVMMITGLRATFGDDVSLAAMGAPFLAG